jgi:hypothetical protein
MNGRGRHGLCRRSDGQCKGGRGKQLEHSLILHCSGDEWKAVLWQLSPFVVAKAANSAAA